MASCPVEVSPTPTTIRADPLAGQRHRGRKRLLARVDPPIVNGWFGNAEFTSALGDDALYARSKFAYSIVNLMSVGAPVAED